MIFGFNSDVTVAQEVCHVQTEDHAPPQCLIETLVYCRGRIVHRHAANYSDLCGAGGFSEDALHKRVQEQHREIVEGLRTGKIAISLGSLSAPLATDGIQVKLRNAASWLAGGNASLDVEVLRRGDQKPVSDAHVEAHLAGAILGTHFTAVTGSDGLAHFRFPLPPLGTNGSELVIRAKAGGQADEIRYSLRSRAKPPATSPKS